VSRSATLLTFCLALTAACATVVTMGGCNRERNEIGDAFAQDRITTLRRSIEAAAKAAATANQELAGVCAEMELHLLDPDRDAAFIAGRRAMSRARSRVDSATDRFNNVNTNAQNLLEEWSREAREYTYSDRKSRSRQELADLSARWQPLKVILRRTGNAYAPLLTILSDDVLALKQRRSALGSTLDGGPTPQRNLALEEVTRATDELNAQAADFIATLPKSGRTALRTAP
jgi:hypothetical protein